MSEMKKTEESSCEDESSNLSKLFADDKVGEDVEGKAFFDLLAQKVEQLDMNNAISNLVVPVENSSTFSENLFISETDRQHDAWIPSASTVQVLEKMVTSTPGSYFPDRDQLTMPGLVLEEDMVDPVKELMAYYIGGNAAAQRKTLTTNDVSQDDDGLKQLIASGNYRSAVNLTGRLLAMMGQGIGKAGLPTKLSPHLLQIWYVRLALLLKLRQFAVAAAEAVPFGNLDNPDVYYEFYPDVFKGRTGSMAPFAFRLLLAELPLHLNQYHDALNRFYNILTIVQQIQKNLNDGLAENGMKLELTPSDKAASQALWEERELRVLFSILNCLLAQKDYISSLDLVMMIIEKNMDHSSELYSLLGRIYLQLGDIRAAQESFQKSKELAKDIDQVRDLINSGLMSIALNKFDEAFKCFNNANELDPDNPIAINNAAVCLLYLGRLRDALASLERAVTEKKNFHEGILFNLCTLFELESSRSSERKQMMLSAVSEHLGDGFNVTCLKLPMQT